MNRCLVCFGFLMIVYAIFFGNKATAQTTYYFGQCPSQLQNSSVADIASLPSRVSLIQDRLSQVSAANLQRIANQFNLNLDHALGQLIIKFQDNLSESVVSSIYSGVQAVQLKVFRTRDAKLVELLSAGSVSDVIAVAYALRELPEVEYVEANYSISIDQLPNDPNLGNLYGLKNTGQDGGTPGSDISAEQAWDVSTGSHNVRVAVIDTGIDCTHPDLAANCWVNPGEAGALSNNGIDDDNNGYIDDFQGWNFYDDSNQVFDDHGHGTHIAGTIGAEGDNSLGVVGVNWQVSLVPLRFLGGAGFGFLSDAVLAIEYATHMDIPISNNSWSGAGRSQTLKDALEAAGNSGHIHVVAAGNYSSDNDSRASYPSGYDLDHIVSVAATDNKDNLAFFSNFGRRTVDIAAPGVLIQSTFPGPAYAKYTGTSMAASYVAGALALLKSTFPSDSAKDLLSRLYKSADPVSSLSHKNLTGGRLNLNAAVRSELDTIAPGEVPHFRILGRTMNSLALEYDPAGDDADLGVAAYHEFRISETEITDETSWDLARRLNLNIEDKNPLNGRTVGTVLSLALSSQGFIAIRALDYRKNKGPIRAIPFTLLKHTVIHEDDAENLDQVEVSGGWGLETVEGRGKVFSDSPNGKYSPSAEASLKVKPIFPVVNPNVALYFDSKVDIDFFDDLGLVELNTGLDWNPITYFSVESCDWATLHMDLDPFLLNRSQFELRFRLISSAIEERNGWLIDNLKIVAEDSAPIVNAMGAGPFDHSAVLQVLLNEPVRATLRWGTSRDNLDNTQSNIELRFLYSMFIDGLTPETDYFYQFVVTDVAGNEVTTRIAEFRTVADTTAPKIGQIVIEDVQQSSAAVSWLTDEPASSEIRWGFAADNLEYGSGTSGERQSHLMTLSPIEPNRRIYFQVTSKDAAGNSTSSPIIHFEGIDTIAPEISDFTFSADLEEGRATMGWSTNELASAVVFSGTDIDNPDKRDDIAGLNVNHLWTLEGIEENTTYHVIISVTDRSGNSTLLAGSIQGLDTLSPLLSEMRILVTGPFTAVISWESDQLANARLTYWKTASVPSQIVGSRQAVGSGGQRKVIEKLEDTLEHEFEIEGLESNSEYEFMVTMIDESGNASESEIFRFSTGPSATDLNLQMANILPFSSASAGATGCSAVHRTQLSAGAIGSWFLSWAVLLLLVGSVLLRRVRSWETSEYLSYDFSRCR